MYHIIHIPVVKDRTKHSKGNGGLVGTNIGFRTKSLDGKGILYGNGCSDFPDCFNCPFSPDECHFDYEKERNRRKNEKNKNQSIQP